MVLVIVRIPASMILFELEGENYSIGELKWLLWNKNRLSCLIPPARACINSPGSIVLSINREFNGPIDALLSGAIIKFRFQRFLCVRKIRCCLYELYCLPFSWFLRVGRFDLKFT
jgi:hypothetical protein